MLIQYLTEDLNGVISKTQYGDKNGEGRIKIVASEEEIYHNLKVAGAGFGVDTNVITVITKDQCIELPLQSKEAAANAILDEAINLI